MKVGKNIEVSLEKKTGSARMMLPFGNSLAIAAPAVIAAGALDDAQIAKLQAKLATNRSLSADDMVEAGVTFDQVNPQEGDYIYPLFRALSQTLIPGYFLDFTKDKVVEEAAPLMFGQTVYTDHVYWRVENALGSVSKSEWDAKGDKTGGVPGINVELKIDWKLYPKIARLLLMKPPAIHSVSATIDFEWDASHPDLLEQGIFWRNLGQDIDGSIVRMVITKILSFYELSLVYQGANPESNGHLPADDDDEENELSAPTLAAPKKPLQVAKPKETTKVKLNEDRKKALGLTAHTGEEVDDAIVLSAVDSLAVRAAAADTIVASARAEVLRLATLAEAGADGTLPTAIANTIADAGSARLEELRALYDVKAAAKFPLTCAEGHPVKGRSSVEDAPVVSAQGKPAGSALSIL